MTNFEKIVEGRNKPSKRVWIGHLGVEPLVGCDVFEGRDDVAGAYVYFLVMARDDSEFRSVASDMSQRVKLNVHEFDQVMPWHDWLKAAADADEYLVERASETEKDGQPRFGEFHLYLSRDEVPN